MKAADTSGLALSNSLGAIIDVALVSPGIRDLIKTGSFAGGLLAVEIGGMMTTVAQLETSTLNPVERIYN